jgi:hypothetical protein
VLPEMMLGPFGILDDAGAVTAAAVFVYKARDGQEASRGCGREGPAEARSAGVTAVFRIRSAHFGAAADLLPRAACVPPVLLVAAGGLPGGAIGLPGQRVAVG